MCTGPPSTITTTPPDLLLGEAAERNFDHPSLTSPFVGEGLLGEEKSFSPKLGEMVRSTREVCLRAERARKGRKGKLLP